MCGISGFISFQSMGKEYLYNVSSSMSDSLLHRGPDDSGIWIDEKVGLSLAHRRLSIIDLSPAGHQPMVSPSKRFVMVFNGEIYNHLEIRKEINAAMNVSWRGHSDTETLLVAIELWGIRKVLQKTVGMFALALWDTKERNLYLARDRVGEKPLYYGWVKGVFVFASELKSLKKYPSFENEIDRDSLSLYFRYSYVPAPRSIYRNIYKLKPGTLIKVDNLSRKISEESYWSLKNIIQKGEEYNFNNDTEAVDTLELKMRESVRMQMISDVPLGAFLSGGIDSSAIVAIMQSESVIPVKTFTIGFHEKNYNEAEYAKEIARHLKTEHTELYIQPGEARDVIPLLPVLYDEPFSDSSQIPTYLVSKLAREHVTVSLSGDAGDELFGGYNRYIWVNSIWKKIKNYPVPLRYIIAGLLMKISPTSWNTVFSHISRYPLIGRKLNVSQPGDKILKIASILDAKNPEEMYRTLISHWKDSENIVINGKGSYDTFDDILFSDIEHKMMYSDFVSYLPDDILVKVDRAAMGVSLESRVPFLDHRIVEYAWSLPLKYKIREGYSKWILRQVLYKFVPKKLIERPKMGFGVPIDSWLRGPLREWAEELLNKDRIENEGFLQYKLVQKKWKEHLDGKQNWQHHLWDILMFQSWLERNGN